LRPPFEELGRREFSRRADAFSGLLPEAKRLRAAAVAELARLEELRKSGERVPDYAVGALRNLVAEAELLEKWERGLPAFAEKLKDNAVELECAPMSIGKALERVSREFGLGIELSPGARQLLGSLEVEVDATSKLGPFLEWLCRNPSRSHGRILVVGHVGEKIVVAPTESVGSAESTAEKTEPRTLRPR
jgi:hypothetical protein